MRAIPGRRDLVSAGRLLSAPLRPLPEVLIIGAQKGGTTFLHDLLAGHPRVAGPLRSGAKELHHFDRRPDGPLLRYRASFPLGVGRSVRRRALESTPSYLLHPAVPAAVARSLPAVRAVAVLREPVARAWSHYAMAVRSGREDRSLEEALSLEAERTAWGRRTAAAGGGVPKGDPYYWSSYLERSRYVPQVERWRAALGADRLLVLRSEDLWADPAGAFDAVVAFIGLEPAPLPVDGLRRNEGGGEQPSAAERQVLVEALAGASDGLRELVGFDWSDRPPSPGDQLAGGGSMP